jgi:hypothetical protein
MPPTVLDSVRQEWADGHRRFEAAASDRPRYERMLEELGVVVDQLRRRVGQIFTLDQLADAYTDADRWIREALAEEGAAPGWPGRLAAVQDAAFHLYSRGAIDYRP